MKKISIPLSIILFLSTVFSFVVFKTSINEYTQNELISNSYNKWGEDLENFETSGPDELAKQEYLMTRDPKTGEVPYHLLFEEYERIKNLKMVDPLDIHWEERGPNNVGGRTRAIMWDPNDPTHQKLWAGGVSGGLWYKNNVASLTDEWQKVEDFWEILSISSITYDPQNTQVFYIGTGEGWFTDRGIPGWGIWKSLDGGSTWNKLMSTSSNAFNYIQKIVVHPANSYVYAATRDTGVVRSTDGGFSWEVVLSSNTPNPSLKDWATDLEITSSGEILASLGFEGHSDGIYISSTGNTGEWTRLNHEGSGLPTAADGLKRIELAVAPSNANVIYALIQGNEIIRPHVIDSDIKGIYRSNDKGESWYPLTIPILRTENSGVDTIFFSATQTGYDLTAAVHPEHPDTVIVGGVSLHRSTDGGNTWTKIDVHDDHHALAFQPGDPQALAFGNDGGVYFTEYFLSNQPMEDHNLGYRVTQFHTCALHPGWGVDYFMGGTQDNFTQQFFNSGMNNTTGVLLSDGGYCYIFKNNPYYQIASKWGNRFYLSTDGGSSFNESDPIYDDKSKGRFISPWDYDENDDVMYASYSPQEILIIKNVTNSSRTPYTQSYNGLFPDWTTAFKVSPFSDKTLFVGTINGKLFKITNASSSTYNADPIILPSYVNDSWINCVELGGNENQILVICCNYNVVSVLETVDGGVNWENKEGNLPAVPVRWGIYNPLDLHQVLVATELGVWTTEDITMSTPVWGPANSGMPNVLTTMLKIRESDHLMIASTYGRGIFSTNSLTVSPSTKILASDGQDEDHFGDAVATNGDFAMVGAPDADERGSDAGAVYVYEPINNQWTESAKLLAPDGADGDNFGGAVDMFDDLAIVGARFDDPDGSAYIYRLSGNTWNLETKIVPNDGSTGDKFGNSVAINNDRAAIGAYTYGGIGAVYIFTYQSGNWIQTDKIIPADGEIHDWFGYSIDLNGDYLIVGNPDDNDNGTISGSAYVYHYSNGWTLDKKIIGDDVDEADQFGWSVAIDGQYAVVGAKADEGVNGIPYAGSAYVFLNSISSNWEQTAKLWALDAENLQNFGYSVSIFGEYILIGARQDSEADTWSGAAYVFKKEGSSSNWLRQNKLFAEDGDEHDLFGTSVQLYGTTAIVSSVWDDDNGYNSGSAYIFKSVVNTNNLPLLSVTPSSFDVTSAQTTVAIQITNNGPPGGAGMDWNAYSLDPWLQFVGDSSGTNSGTVTISVDENLYCAREGRIIVRAPGALHSPREVSIHQQAGPGPNEVKIIANDPDASDYFGYSVDVDGNYAIVGAVRDDEFGSDAGAAYIYERDGCCSWVQKAKLRVTSSGNYDGLGQSVAISGDVALVGTTTRTKVFIFEKPIGGWQDMTETAKLVPSDGAINQYFGHSVDISGEFAIVGAPLSKKIFIYERPEGGWQDMSETYSYHSPSSGYNSFGVSVAIDNDYAAVGCTKVDALSSPGKVYVFKLDWVWGLQAELVPGDSQNMDYFGSSVDIDANRIIVGAENVEAAYIFEKDKDGVWREKQKLTGGTAFGFAAGSECVSIDGNYALVGARQSSDSSNIRTGSAFSFIRKEAGWLFSKQIFSNEHEQIAEFGGAVSISGPYTIISADHSTLNGVWYTGAAYVYCTEGDIVTSVETPQEQALPVSYDLKQNYPNPFNPVTTIVFDLPRPTNVTLKIYTILGEEVTSLVSEELMAGTHKYTWNPVSLASGIYLYRIESKEYTITKKMVYLK